MDKKEIKGCKIVGRLGGKFEHTLDLTRRVYDVNAVAPTITTCGGGNTEPKIMEDEYLAVWDGFNQKVRKDSDTIGTLTGNCHKDLKRNGQGIIEKDNARIRKLTERECGRLMGVKDDDIAKIGKNLSRSAMMHCFGDSIVTACLMAIFGKMFNVDYESKIKELTKKLTGEG